MDAIKILHSDFLELLFDGRNKAYGAYDLRKNYNQRLQLSMMLTAALTLSIFLLMNLFQQTHNFTGQSEPDELFVRTIQEQKLPPAVPLQQKMEQPQKVATTKLVSIIIKKDHEVKQHELPPINEIQKVDIMTQDGKKDDEVVNNIPSMDKGKGILLESKKNEEDAIVERVEIEANINLHVWRRYLENHLQRYIEDAANAGMNPGTYTVQVRFLVERDGSITDVKALNDPGYGLAKGAEEVVRRGPRWNPGEQNGRKVRSYHTQPITFVISEQ